MMADKSGRILGAQPGAAQTSTRKATAPTDDRMPVCSDAGQAGQEQGNSFSAKLQDAAAARRRSANADSEAAARRSTQSGRAEAGRAEARRADAREASDTTGTRQRGQAASSDDAKPTSGDDGGTQRDAARGDGAAAGQGDPATQCQPQATEAGSPQAAQVAAQIAAGGPEASPLAAQLLTMLDAAQQAIASGGVASSLSLAAGAGAGAAAALDTVLPAGIAAGTDGTANGLQPSTGKAAQLENYARELERAAAMPSTVLEGERKESTSGPGSVAAGPATGTSSSASPPIANALQTLTNNLALHHGPAELAPRSLEASVGSKAWREQLGNQLSWMMDRGEQLATLRLSPDHLGPLEVKIAVRESEATVWFGATQPETRAALEQAMPRLRDMLASQGIALTQSGVSSGSPQDTPRGNAAAARFGAAATVAADEPVAELQRMSNRGLVDLYA